jgi:hypothetical protein
VGFLFFINSFLSFFTLNIIQGDRGRNLLALPISPGDTWQIHYIHSLYRVPQEEIYRLSSKGEMILEEMRFGSYAAALYYNENPVQGFIQEGRWWKIEEIHHPLSHFHFKVGYTTDCRLLAQGKSIPFDSLAPPGTSLTFRVKKNGYGRVLISWLFGREKS